MRGFLPYVILFVLIFFTGYRPLVGWGLDIFPEHPLLIRVAAWPISCVLFFAAVWLLAILYVVVTFVIGCLWSKWRNH